MPVDRVHKSPRQDERGLTSLDKGLQLLSAIIADDGLSTLSSIADAQGLAQSTTRRLAATFQRHGFLAKAERGHFVLGPALHALGTAHTMSEVLRRVARGALRQIARQHGVTCHLGIFEGGMVTYLVKEQGGREPVFSREGQQLEAYCSAIGKVLLAQLPDDELDRYCAQGDFVALTGRTITAGPSLKAEVLRVRANAYAVDRAESAEHIQCVATPLPVQAVMGLGAGISISGSAALSDQRLAIYREALASCANDISNRLGCG